MISDSDYNLAMEEALRLLHLRNGQRNGKRKEDFLAAVKEQCSHQCILHHLLLASLNLAWMLADEREEDREAHQRCKGQDSDRFHDDLDMFVSLVAAGTLKLDYLWVLLLISLH